MKIALIQMNSTADKEKNIDRAMRLVIKAISNKAKFILLPEIFHYRGPADKAWGYQRFAEFIPGESSIPFMILARKYRVHILLGSLYEKVRGEKKVYNTSILINDRGEIAATYRKIHLFSACLGKKNINESKFLLAGKTPVMTDIKGFKAGLSVCYDLRFPKLYQEYQRQGAHILTVPSSFTETTGRAHWEVLLRARAIENLAFVLAPNQYGKTIHGVEAYGHSMVIDPWGKILAMAKGPKEQIIFATLHRKTLMQARRQLPSVKEKN